MSESTEIAPRYLSQDEVKRLARPQLARWFVCVAFEWSLIAAAIAVAVSVAPLWARILLAIFIGTRIHALGILAHEGVHYSLLRSKRYNDLVANLFTGYPLFLTVQGYRTNHLKHHWRLETPEDPSKITLDSHPQDWTFPMRPRRVFWILVRDLVGLSQASSISLLRYLWNIPNRRLHMLAIAIMHGTALTIAILLDHSWAYWGLYLLPAFTVTPMCYRIRGVAEHSAVVTHDRRFKREKLDVLATTRTTLVNPVFGALLAPYNVSYHVEHHLYPAVSCFLLPEVHRALMAQASVAQALHVTRGHTGLFRELTAEPVHE